jgi:hypothetical protein
VFGDKYETIVYNHCLGEFFAAEMNSLLAQICQLGEQAKLLMESSISTGDVSHLYKSGFLAIVIENDLQ